MDLNAVLLNYGSVLEAGKSEFVWNPDGTLAVKRLYADLAQTQEIYTKTFTWNLDGNLHHWTLVVVTTGESITKTFTWNLDGSLAGAEVVAS